MTSNTSSDDWARPILAAGATYAAAGILSVVGGIQVTHVVWTTLAAMAGVVLALSIRQATTGSIAYTMAAIAAAGAWLAYTVADSPWTTTAATAWATGTLLLGPVHPAMRSHHARSAARRTADLEDRELRRRSGEWVALWARAGIKGLAEIRREETRAGLKVYMELPEDGRVKLEDMERACTRVEIAHGALRRGAIQVEEGDLAHEVIVHINAIDVLAETIPIPEDVQPRSGSQPFGIGRHEDGGECLLSLDKHAMIAGITDAGKSNLVNAIIKAVGECVDTVIWVIDPKGGRLAAPWLQAWLEEQADRPVVDWVATKEAEWDLMLDAGLAIQVARSEARLGGEKVTASPSCPRILIVIDEIADVTANRRTLKKIKELARKGRSEEIKLILVGQRGTVTMFGDGDTKSQIGHVIGLGVARVADGQAIFPDDRTIARSLARMQHPGCMYVRAGNLSRPMPSKAYRITYDQIPVFAAQLADLRPGLDDLSADAAGEAYAQRWEWERCSHLVRQPSHAPAESAAEPVDDAAAFAAITATYGTPIPPILAAVEEVFERLNAERLHTKVILRELPAGIGETTGKRLGMLLGELGVSPIEAWPEGSDRLRGYRRQDLAEARARIEAGTQDVPAWVHAWPAESVS